MELRLGSLVERLFFLGMHSFMLPGIFVQILDEKLILKRERKVAETLEKHDLWIKALQKGERRTTRGEKEWSRFKL